MRYISVNLLLLLLLLLLFHTILFLKSLCIMVLKEKNMIGWNPI